jgi:hypothetical protein
VQVSSRHQGCASEGPGSRERRKRLRAIDKTLSHVKVANAESKGFALAKPYPTWTGSRKTVHEAGKGTRATCCAPPAPPRSTAASRTSTARGRPRPMHDPTGQA